MRVVLVPFDGSQASSRALALATKWMPRAPESRLHLLNVQSPPLHPWPGRLVSPDTIQAELGRQGTDLLRTAYDGMEGAGMKTELHVRVGSPAEEIVRCAEEIGCEAIVMGTRGLGAAAAFALGSVASKVAHLSRLPVVLVK